MNAIFYAHLLRLLVENPSSSWLAPADQVDELAAPAAVLEIRITNEQSRSIGVLTA
ncbi:hypothetical protein ABZ897_43425 [Nonomuraea sp. NPDC046802]|uniref:hypothetical protein n=1 Tax=Nonomuraea sp. NPDC046802 TaxID=3154919 RepID=UPI0033C7D6E0